MTMVGANGIAGGSAGARMYESLFVGSAGRGAWR